MEEPDRPPLSSGSRPLTAWKEIAHYLSVNVRTAQKWERERGLPIRRASGARSRVSADTASLEVWKQQIHFVKHQQDRCYRWPLRPGLTVEIRFEGIELAPAHIDLLREYLDLFKKTLR